MEATRKCADEAQTPGAGQDLVEPRIHSICSFALGMNAESTGLK